MIKFYAYSHLEHEHFQGRYKTQEQALQAAVPALEDYLEDHGSGIFYVAELIPLNVGSLVDVRSIFSYLEERLRSMEGCDELAEVIGELADDKRGGEYAIISNNIRKLFDWAAEQFNYPGAVQVSAVRKFRISSIGEPVALKE